MTLARRCTIVVLWKQEDETAKSGGVNESESEDDDLGKKGTEVYVATPQEETEVR